MLIVKLQIMDRNCALISTTILKGWNNVIRY